MVLVFYHRILADKLGAVVLWYLQPLALAFDSTYSCRQEGSTDVLTDYRQFKQLSARAGHLRWGLEPATYGYHALRTPH